MKRLIGAAFAAALLLAGTGVHSASAHANLIQCTVKNNEVFHLGHTPGSIQAKFAEDLDPNPNHTWMAVFEGVADHGLVTEKEHSMVKVKNPQVMTLKLPHLAVDKYYLIWYTHSAIDGHYAAGIVYFQVKK